MDKDSTRRAKNFTDLEKKLLLGILVDFKHITENKKTDKVNVRLKNEAWDEISKKYNVHSQTGPRNGKQLHALYDLIKKKKRKSLRESLHQGDMYKTPIGAFTYVSDKTENQIFAVRKPEYTWLENKFESSSVYLEEPKIMSETGTEGSISIKSDVEKEEEISISNTDDILRISPIPSLEASNSDVSQQDLSTKKRENGTTEMLRKRIVGRKRFTTVLNGAVFKKKQKILTAELMAKEKALILTNYDLMIKEQELKIKEKELELKEKNILLKNEEILHRRKMQQIELEMKEKELEIKKWEHSMKFDEHKFYVDNTDYKT